MFVTLAQKLAAKITKNAAITNFNKKTILIFKSTLNPQLFF